MANVIKHKRGSGSDPTASDLVVGEVAIRTDVGKLFTKMDNGSVAEIAGGGSDIAINTLSSSSGTGGGSATFNGSAYRFTLSAPPSVSAQQLLVSINGVIQKPVAGTGQPSEGFSVDGTDIILGDAPATGSDFFILTFKSLGVSEPADNSVTSAKIVDGAIVNADINASAAIAGTKISPDFGSQNITTLGNIICGDGSTGVLNIKGNQAFLQFTDANDNDDFEIRVDGGIFRIQDQQNDLVSLQVNTDGHVDIPVNLDVGAGLDVTGDITGTGDLTIDTNTLHVDSANNRVGIGKTSDIHEKLNILDASQAANSRSGGLLLQCSATSGADVGVPIAWRGQVGNGTEGQTYGLASICGRKENATYSFDAASAKGYLQFCTTDNSGAERMRITSGGNVGIGTTSPQNMIHTSSANDSSGIRMTNTFDTPDNVWALLPSISGVSNTGFTIRDVTDGRNCLVINGSGDVGIGTSSPESAVHFKHATDNAVLRLESGDEYVHILFKDSTTTSLPYIGAQGNNLRAITGGAERMRIDSSGNVSIGSTSNVAPLNVRGMTDGNLHIRPITSIHSGTGVGIDILNNASDTVKDLAIRAATTVFRNASGETMRIDSSGNIAIGTTSPVNNSGYGGITLNGGSGAIFSFKDSDVEKTRLALVANDTFSIQYPPGSSGHFRIDSLSADGSGNITGATERMRVDSSGNVGIGQSPSYRLDVIAGQGAVSRFRQATNNQGITHACIILRHQAASSSQQGVGMVFQNSSGSEVGSIRFGPSTSYNTTSDYRLKENVIPISDGITRLKTLKPSRFNFTANPETTVDGFLAHEVTAVPEAITGSKDQVDSDNNPVYQSIDQSKLVPLLVAALQEAIGRIEALEAK